MEPDDWWAPHARFIYVDRNGVLTFKSELRDLTNEEELLYNRIVLAADVTVIFNSELYRISACDIKTMLVVNGREKGMLNDECINAYMKILQQRANNMGAKIWFMNSNFYGFLKTEGYDKVSRWTKNVDIFDKDKIVFPIHFEDKKHWTLGIINMRDRRFEYYDSLSGLDEKYSETMSLYIQMEAMNKEKKFDILNWNKTKVNGTYLPLQNNGIDCGVFVCQYAECFSRDVWPTFSPKDMPVFRRRMVVELATGKLLPP